ncbi:MAG: GtrA family protein [Dysgonamonadaceae bacterium]|jgi:putative flippase GtrA|nr:GtrA family protein [Dysgonamonadaceae bacterium]
MQNGLLIQALKYGIVGVMNTLLTALTIWFMMHVVFGIDHDESVSSLIVSISNTIGYIVGLVNSFLWNRSWTFKSNKNWKVDFYRFLIAFAICFGLQLLLVNGLNTYLKINTFQFCLLNHEYNVNFAYICQLIGIVFYTVLNFVFNKYYTFKK